MNVRFVLVVVAALATSSCKKSLDANELDLSETYRAPTGSAILAYPSSMVPKIEKSGVIGLRPKQGSAFDRYDSVIVTDHPKLRPEIAALDAYVTFLHETHERELKKWATTARAPTTCLAQYPGVELTATFEEDDGTPARYWSCTFVASNHGFKVAYTTRESAVASDAPALRKIADAVRVSP